LALLGGSALMLASLTARAADTVVGDDGNAATVFLTSGILALAIIAGFLVVVRFRRRTADLRRLTLLLADKTQAHDALARDLSRRDALLSAIANCANELVGSVDQDRSYAKALELIGAAAEADVAWLSRIELAEDGGVLNDVIVHWVAPHLEATWNSAAFRRFDLRAAGPARWIATLLRSEILTEIIGDLPATEGIFFRRAGVRSVTVVPIFEEGRWWGTIGFADFAKDRKWSEAEKTALQATAELFGNVVGRARVQAELLTAGRILENSPTLLFRIRVAAPPELVYLSQNVERYGYRAAELLAAPNRWLYLFHPDDQPIILSDVQDLLAGRIRVAHREMRFRRSDGSWVWFEGRLAGISGDKGGLDTLEGMLVDITDRKLGEERIAYLARHDALTGLANRTAFVEQLEEVFAVARRGGPGFAVHYFDLDHFKDFNDAFGHAKGDLLLKSVGERLAGMLREADIVARVNIARFGGDEFAILQTGVSEPADAGALAARINRVVAQPYSIADEKFHITASIGISLYDARIAKADEMLSQADLALYRAKDEGRNQFRFHSQDLDQTVRDRVAITEELRGALDRGELELFFQPQIEIPSNRIVGLEALARWNHPTRGAVPPDLFIGVAEKSGLIVALGHWVMDRACQQLHQWTTEGIAPPRLSFNVSAAQIKLVPHFDRDVAETLRKWDVDPARVEIEITESILVETTTAHSDIFARLHELGIGLAIDDFGTGYSSLEYLRLYPVNRLKIAQQFVRGMPDSGNAAIIRAMIGLAREFGIAVVAEGVETAAQLQFLLAAGCHEIQGHYFSPPVAAAPAGEILREGKIERTVAAA
jgi:diguanylate cyclase (GGDEF)-like protein/PAS domain S-box-containing protein